jgi:ACS family pantothenate transporter-like MFS transporter
MAALEKSDAKIAASVLPTSSFEVDSTPDTQEERRSLRHRFREVIWDSWDRSPEERKFVSKIDFFIL